MAFINLKFPDGAMARYGDLIRDPGSKRKHHAAHATRIIADNTSAPSDFVHLRHGRICLGRDFGAS